MGVTVGVSRSDSWWTIRGAGVLEANTNVRGDASVLVQARCVKPS